jgi:hypothetical protein
VPLQRYRVSWTNWPGAPGVTTLYLSTSVADYSHIRTFFNTIKDLFPTNLTFTFPSVVDIINETNGQLTGSIATTPGAVVTSTASSQGYAGSAGGMIRWNTAAIVDGTRVTGRTYLVPLHQNSYFTDGSLVSATITSIQTAATTLLAAYADGVKVFSRPYPGRAAVGTPGEPGYKPARAARVGSYATALSALVPDLAVVMRSRRI